MKEIRITWAEIVLFLIGAAVTIYRIVTDIISYTGMQIMLLEYDPGTAAYEERAASLPFPLIDCGICAFILLALIIVILIKLIYKGGSKDKKAVSHDPLIKTTNVSAPAGKGFRVSNPDGTAATIGTCPECGARIYRLDGFSRNSEKSDADADSGSQETNEEEKE